MIAIVEDKVVNTLPFLGDQPNVLSKNFEKEVGRPSSIIDLIEVLGKEISDLLRTSMEVQEKKGGYYKSEINVRRFITITENMKIFFFAFELGFNRCILKVKEFFSNIDKLFLTLTDLDAQSLIKEVMKGDLYSFMASVIVALDRGLKIAAFDPPSEDGPPSNRS